MYDDIQKTGGWIFVIDTEEYAGNFEREMTAYITGKVGECTVGEEMTDLYKSETGDKELKIFDDVLEYRNDNHGCSRPCSIHTTPGWINDGVGNHEKSDGKGFPAYLSVAIFFFNKPSKKLIELMKSRAKTFSNAKRQVAKQNNRPWDETFDLKITGFRLIKENISYIEKNI